MYPHTQADEPSCGWCGAQKFEPEMLALDGFMYSIILFRLHGER